VARWLGWGSLIIAAVAVLTVVVVHQVRKRRH
jgi:hypothetical protein